MKDDNTGTKSRNGFIQLKPLRGGLQFHRKMLQVSLWRIAKKLEQVSAEALCSRSVDDDVGNCQNLQKKTHSLIVVARHSQHAFRIHDDGPVKRVICGPDPGRARVLQRGRLEYISSLEECVIQRVRFAVSSVAKNRNDLGRGALVAGQLADEVVFVSNLTTAQY